jgi:hypothetical protein
MSAPIRPLPPLPWNQLARSEYRVDQGAILAALQAQRNVHALVARNGFCMALVLDWVSRTLGGRLPGASTYSNATSAGMKACVADHVTGYFAAATGVAQITGVSKALGLVPREVARGSAVGTPLGVLGAPAVVAGAVLKHACRQGVGLLFIQLGGGAHAIGFRVIGGTFRFFDPNFGSFVARDRPTFNKALQGLLEDEYSSVNSYEIYDFAQGFAL